MNLQFLLVDFFWKMAKVSQYQVEKYTSQNYNRRETIEKKHISHHPSSK